MLMYSHPADLFFSFTGWLFCASLLFGASWFNPFQLELRMIRHDVNEWIAWMLSEDGRPESSWSAWYAKETGTQYDQANIGTRCWRIIRVSRLLLLAALMLFTVTASVGQEGMYLVMWVAVAGGTIVCFQAAHTLTAVCAPRREAGSDSSTTAAHTGECPAAHRILRGSLQGAAYIAAVIAVVNLTTPSPSWAGDVSGLDLQDATMGYIAFCVLLFWMSRVLNIASAWPCADGIRAVHKLFDIKIGVCLIAVQGLCAMLIPLGTAIHSRMLFSSEYSDTVEIITGACGRIYTLLSWFLRVHTCMCISTSVSYAVHVH